MGQTERLYKIERLLRGRRKVPMSRLLHDLEVTRATINRDLALLRDRIRMPIVYDRALRGYRFDAAEPDAPPYELPGLWFNSREIHALLAFHHFLENLDPGLLSAHIAPVKERIKALLQSKDQALEQITRRVRILPQAARAAEPACFQHLAHALLERKRLRLTYHGRARDATTDRVVSPQRLAHYRDNWYVDVWDHRKRALRTFSVDRIRDPKLLDREAKDIPDERLDRHFASSYGIFAGKAKRKAVLRFTPERARWVAEEHWHPQQIGRFDGDHYVLEVPYSDPRELVMDILKFGSDIEVLAPAALRQQVANRLREALRKYESGEKRRQ